MFNSIPAHSLFIYGRNWATREFQTEVQDPYPTNYCRTYIGVLVVLFGSPYGHILYIYTYGKIKAINNIDFADLIMEHGDVFKKIKFSIAIFVSCVKCSNYVALFSVKRHFSKLLVTLYVEH